LPTKPSTCVEKSACRCRTLVPGGIHRACARDRHSGGQGDAVGLRVPYTESGRISLTGSATCGARPRVSVNTLRRHGVTNVVAVLHGDPGLPSDSGPHEHRARMHWPWRLWGLTCLLALHMVSLPLLVRQLPTAGALVRG